MIVHKQDFIDLIGNDYSLLFYIADKNNIQFFGLFKFERVISEKEIHEELSIIFQNNSFMSKDNHIIIYGYIDSKITHCFGFIGCINKIQSIIFKYFKNKMFI